MVARGSDWSWCELMATGPSRSAAAPSGRPAPPGSSAPLIIPLRPRQTCAALGKSDIESGDPIWKGKLKSCCCCGDMKASSSPRTIMNPGGRKGRRGGIVRRADESLPRRGPPSRLPSRATKALGTTTLLSSSTPRTRVPQVGGMQLIALDDQNAGGAGPTGRRGRMRQGQNLRRGARACARGVVSGSLDNHPGWGCSEAVGSSTSRQRSSGLIMLPMGCAGRMPGAWSGRVPHGGARLSMRLPLDPRCRSQAIVFRRPRTTESPSVID